MNKKIIVDHIIFNIHQTTPDTFLISFYDEGILEQYIFKDIPTINNSLEQLGYPRAIVRRITPAEHIFKNNFSDNQIEILFTGNQQELSHFIKDILITWFDYDHDDLLSYPLD